MNVKKFAKLSLDLPSGATRDFYYRHESKGDKAVIDQIFSQNCYELSSFKMAERLFRYAEVQRRNGNKLLVIDAGANIGASSLYFSEKFDDSFVVAIEPERKNFELLKLNVAIEKTRVIGAGISSTNGRMFLNDPGNGDWGFRVSDQGDYEVDTVTVNSILADLPTSRYSPFICKIDIEGGEADVFKADFDWLGKFPLLIIELHDWMLPGEGNSRNLMKALLSFNFDFVFRGENAFCFNIDLLNSYATPREDIQLDEHLDFHKRPKFAKPFCQFLSSLSRKTRKLIWWTITFQLPARLRSRYFK